jgi:hypothetical protein
VKIYSNALDGWDIYYRWMKQEKPRKYTRPTSPKITRGDRKMYRMTLKKMGNVNWRHVAQDKDGWRSKTREVLSLHG